MSTFSTFPRICSYCNLLPHNNFLHWRPIHISLIARNCRRLISKWIICCDREYLRDISDATVFKSLPIIRMQAVQRLMNDPARPWWNYAPGLKYLKCWFICANVYFPSRRISTVIYRNTTHIPKKISTPVLRLLEHIDIHEKMEANNEKIILRPWAVIGWWAGFPARSLQFYWTPARWISVHRKLT